MRRSSGGICLASRRTGAFGAKGVQLPTLGVKVGEKMERVLLRKKIRFAGAGIFRPS
jgi:hypothetical protein